MATRPKSHLVEEMERRLANGRVQFSKNNGDSGVSLEAVEPIYADIADLDPPTPELEMVEIAASVENAAESYLPTPLPPTPLPPTPLPPTPPSRCALNWVFFIARAGFVLLICRKTFSIGAMFFDLGMDYWLATK